MIDSVIGLKCPYCGSVKTHVTDSRYNNRRQTTKRKRECLACGRRFNTVEEIADTSRDRDKNIKPIHIIHVNQVEADEIRDNKLTCWIVKNAVPHVGDLIQMCVSDIFDDTVKQPVLDDMKYEVTCTLSGISYGLVNNCCLCSFRPYGR